MWSLNTGVVILSFLADVDTSRDSASQTRPCREIEGSLPMECAPTGVTSTAQVTTHCEDEECEASNIVVIISSAISGVVLLLLVVSVLIVTVLLWKGGNKCKCRKNRQAG